MRQSWHQDINSDNGQSLLSVHTHVSSISCREIMMGVGNRVVSVIMLTFPSEPCPHADFSK